MHDAVIHPFKDAVFIIQEYDKRLMIKDDIGHISFLGSDEWCYSKQFSKVESAFSNNNSKLWKQQTEKN